MMMPVSQNGLNFECHINSPRNTFPTAWSKMTRLKYCLSMFEINELFRLTMLEKS